MLLVWLKTLDLYEDVQHDKHDVKHTDELQTREWKAPLVFLPVTDLASNKAADAELSLQEHIMAVLVMC